jgi:hypothetical protein
MTREPLGGGEPEVEPAGALLPALSPAPPNLRLLKAEGLDFDLLYNAPKHQLSITQKQ